MTKTEQMIMNILKKEGVFKHHSGVIRRKNVKGHAYGKLYTFGKLEANAIAKLRDRGLVTVKTEIEYGSIGERDIYWIVASK